MVIPSMHILKQLQSKTGLCYIESIEEGYFGTEEGIGFSGKCIYLAT